jgi:hypothetical protein
LSDGWIRQDLIESGIGLVGLDNSQFSYFAVGSILSSSDPKLLGSLRKICVVSFRLKNLQNLLAIPTFSGSTLLESHEHKEKLNEFYGQPDQQWELIYKASRDGFEAKYFHVKCNGEGSTMTIF